MLHVYGTPVGDDRGVRLMCRRWVSFATWLFMRLVLGVVPLFWAWDLRRFLRCLLKFVVLVFGFATSPSFLRPLFRSAFTSASLSSALTTSTIGTSSSCDSRSRSTGSSGGPIVVLLKSFWIWSSPFRDLTWSPLGFGMRGGDVSQKVSGRFSLTTCWTWSAPLLGCFEEINSMHLSSHFCRIRAFCNCLDSFFELE